MNKLSNFLWGLVFVAIGLILGLNSLGITDINIFFKGWWTLFIIIPCFIGLFKTSGKWGSLVGFLIGVLLLLAAQGLISISIIMKLIVPIILVAIGLGIMFNGFVTKSISKKMKNIDKTGMANYAATFSEQRADFSNEEFKGATLDAVFGSVKLDLQKSIIKEDQMITASAIFGGITILAPSGVNIKVNATPIFGGVDNKMQNTKGENIPTIYINAFCMFGGVDIK